MCVSVCVWVCVWVCRCVVCVCTWCVYVRGACMYVCVYACVCMWCVYMWYVCVVCVYNLDCKLQNSEELSCNYYICWVPYHEEDCTFKGNFFRIRHTYLRY